MGKTDKANFTDQTKFRLNEISKIENYFKSEINQKKSCSKKLSKYVSALDNVLIVLSAMIDIVCIISSVIVVGAPVKIAGASFTLIFPLTTGIIKKLPSITRNKEKRHDKIFIFAKSKLNSIETLVSQALIDMEISHEEFITILKEKDKYEKIKETLKNVSKRSFAEKQKNVRLNSVNSRT